jgi:hypothetical protein
MSKREREEGDGREFMAWVKPRGGESVADEKA